MSDIGPELPPHLLAKRKRKQEDEAENEATIASGANGSKGPNEEGKRRRVVGPVMPPAPLDEKPEEAPKQAEDSDSDDEDGFGPAMPQSEANETFREYNSGNDDVSDTQTKASAPREKPKRDDWMIMPPKQDDLAARLDPTKQRARGFNTGKGAKGPNPIDNDNSSWNETAVEKQKRLADEMMGVSRQSGIGPQTPEKGSGARRDEAATQKIREHTEKTRGPSLLEQHTGSKGAEAEDDPSKRTFDREKDMGSGMRISQSDRREMLNKASNFSSKFSGGSYL